MSFLPTVLFPLTLQGLLHHILAQSPDTGTTLLICSSRETFLQDLLQSLQADQNEIQEQDDTTLQDLATPSLHNIFTTRHVKLVFCGSVQGLLAYLVAYGRHGSTNAIQAHSKARLVLVNPLALHATTPAFSAQGLSRAFAAATETALRTGAALQVVECQIRQKRAQVGTEGNGDMTMSDEGENDQANEAEVLVDPWEQEVSILNVSARRFGSNSSDRAWAGRTVKAKSVAARWLRFQRLDDGEKREGLG